MAAKVKATTPKEEVVEKEETIVEEPTVEDTPVEDTPVEDTPTEVTPTEETPVVAETPSNPIVAGTVVHCKRLRIRKGANAKTEVLSVINEGTKVSVDLSKSTDSFYHVTFDKIVGFCMKSYIEV